MKKFQYKNNNMKRIILIFLGLFSLAYAQYSPTGAKTQFKNGLGLGSKDSSAFLANDSLAITIDRNNRLLWRNNGSNGTWNVVAKVGVGDFIINQSGSNLSAQTAKFRITDTGWINNVLRTNKALLDSIQASSSAGGYLVTNGGSAVMHWGGGGSVEVDFKGFAGYDANRSSSYTVRSFTDKRYVDSADALRLLISDTANMLSKLTFDRVLANGNSTGRNAFLGYLVASGASAAPTVTGAYLFDQRLLSIQSGGTSRPFAIDAQYLSFGTGNTYSEKARIDSFGSLLIGTSTSNAGLYKLDVNGQIRTNTLVSFPSGGSYVVSNAGILSSRTASEVRTDIGAGTVTSIATNNGTGITGGTITTSGTIAIDTTSTISTKANVTALLLGKVDKSSISGTSGTFPIFGASNSLGNSTVTDNGSLVTIGSRALAVGVIQALATPASAYLVSNSGTINSRTPSEVLSDIGGVPTSQISGTNGTIAAFGSGNSVVNSNITDNGSNVAIGGGRALAIASIPSMGSPASTFVVSNSGTLNSRTASQVLSDIGGVGGTGVSGRVGLWNSTTTQTSNSLLNYDGTNNILGVGTTTPFTGANLSLDVDGGLMIKKTGSKNAALTIINANPAGAGNDGYLSATAGGATSTAFSSIQSSYGSSNTAPLRLNPDGGAVLLRTTTTQLGANETLAAYNNNASFSISAVGTSSSVPPIGVWNTATSGDNNFLVFYTEGSPTSRGSITYNRGSGVTAYNTTSDYRAKRDEQPINNALGMVMSLKPKSYFMLDGTRRTNGFFAHELQEVIPQAVTGTKDAIDSLGKPIYQQVDLSQIIPILTKAFQEEHAERLKLEARVAKLEELIKLIKP